MNVRSSFKKITLLYLFVCLFLLNACQSTKKVAYFQDISLAEQSELAKTAQYTEPIIQIDDILSISIFTIDPNSGMVINQLGNQAISTGSTTANALGATAPTSGFLVDKNGEIDLSIIGKIKLAGLTTFEARELIKTKAGVYYTKPNAQVRFANFKITVLGEVAKPASYVIPNEKVTVLDGLGLAGDLTIYGKRENVVLIREANGKKEFARLNLNSKELFNSPYYYLKQNDVIYVEPNKGKAASLNQARTQTIAIIGTALTVLIALISRL